jgi:hypothetical protein
MMEVLAPVARSVNLSRLLYEHDFPDWFVVHASSYYQFNLDEVLMTLRNGRFFFPDIGYFGMPTDNITGRYLDKEAAQQIGENFIQRLAALTTTLPNGDSVANSLQLDGYSVNTQKLRLVPLENVVSAQEEGDALTVRVNSTGISNAETVLQHIADAKNLFVESKYHPSLNESRNVLQCLVDNISIDTHNNGAHSTKLPRGTANRIGYLREVGFLTTDEEAAFKSAWGALSAGSHPGVPDRDEARIGLILALEFGQLLLLKFGNWKTNAYKKFSHSSRSLRCLGRAIGNALNQSGKTLQIMN